MPGIFGRSADETLLRVAVGFRVLLATLVTVFTVMSGPTARVALCLLVALAALTTGAFAHMRVPGRWWPVAETVAVAGAVVTAGGPDGMLAPLLVAPVFAAGLAGGAFVAALATSVVLLMTVVHGVLHADSVSWTSYGQAAVQFGLLAAVLGGIGAWARVLVDTSSGQLDPYHDAQRLLTELRKVARRLPTGLDSRGIAVRLLDDIRSSVPFREGSVLVGAGPDAITIAQHVHSTVTSAPVPLTVSIESADGRPAVLVGQRGPSSDESHMTTLTLPLVAADRTIGDVVLVVDTPGEISTETYLALTPVLDEAAVRLHAAVLFDEVRDLATVEERQRLAREIHDGVAQELASVCYALDNALAEPTLDEMAQHVTESRSQLRRVLNELRLSIYQLRSDVRESVSLGTALSTYVRSVARDWGLDIKLNVSEATGRLAADVESELLRIAQEALTNARKHSGADLIKVTLIVEPPNAWLRIEDNGTGFAQSHSAKSFGLQIMRERAERIGARFRVAPGSHRGTVVDVLIGTPTGASLETLQKADT